MSVHPDGRAMLYMRWGRFMCTGCPDAFVPRYMQSSGHPGEEKEEKEAETGESGAKIGLWGFLGLA